MITFGYADDLWDTHKDLLDQMFSLRAKSFHVRRGWSVSVVNNKEIDYYDSINPLYVMSVNPNGQLMASLRLLPTTGPHMVSDIFPETMGDNPIIRNQLILESSRFCVDTTIFNKNMPNGLNLATSELLVGMFEIALELNIKHIVSVYDLFMERILKRAGCLFHRLGTPYAYDGLKTVAGLFEVSQLAIDLIHERSEFHGNVITNHKAAPTFMNVM